MARLGRLLAITLLVALLPGRAPAAAQGMKHSGVIVSVSESTGMLVIRETGPSKAPHGRAVLRRLAITVTAHTEFAMVSPEAPAPPGPPSPLVVRPIGAWAVYTGDFVTIECLHERRRLIATKVTVTYVPAD
jgi:hypothetical protein